jgi:predicted dehydrogenase
MTALADIMPTFSRGGLSMARSSRRDFLKQAAASGAGVALATNAFDAFAAGGKKKKGAKATGKIIGANERIRIAVVGINGRGSEHIHQFASMDGVEVAYLVDPDTRLYANRVKAVESRAGNKPQCVQDLRKALEDKNLNAISVATCNHWHSLATIWGCQAGKDVYVEKPCSHNVFEGRQCVEAARKYNRIVQHGTQSRSDARWARSTAAVKSGKYGKLLVAKAYASKERWSIGYKPAETPPKEFDFNLWLGPALDQAYHANIVHYNWHWFWDFGNGEIGNQGVHQMDIGRWGLPEVTQPFSAMSIGCRYVDTPNFRDQGQTPNMQLAVFDFGGPLLVFEVRGLNKKKGPGPKRFDIQVDNEFYTEQGVIRDGKFYPKGKDKPEPLPELPRGIQPEHFANFIAAVRSRKMTDLNAEILEGHRSAILCHLANISYRLGADVPFSQKPKGLGDNEHVLASVKSIEDQLQGALGMDLGKYTYTLGAKLQFCPKAEKFVGNTDADKLLSRAYRAPFVVPEKV